MEENKTTSSLNRDIIFWALIAILLIAGIVASVHFREVVWSIRFALWIVLAGILLGLAYLTAQGKRFLTFVKSARMELYKVVWPTRDETVKTTAVVAVLVFAMSLILWMLDSFLLWIVGWFTR
jgi:preprotein translocase subunit SecE